MSKNIYDNERELIGETARLAGYKPEDVKDYFFSHVDSFPVLWILFKGNENTGYLDYYWEFSKALKARKD
jgi:hypothetical protein